VVSVTEDLIRTPPERTAQIVAEAEDQSLTVLYATTALVAGYTVQMLRLLARQRAGTDEGRVPDAG
jgi:hypothetical protein